MHRFSEHWYHGLENVVEYLFSSIDQALRTGDIRFAGSLGDMHGFQAYS